MKFAFYLMNSKGLFVLQSFIKKFGSDAIEYVVAARDSKLQNDSFNEIKILASSNEITFYNRAKFPIEIEEKFNGFKFSIGWRWLIQNESNLIVFHDSLLPRYRGFAPLVNSLVNNEGKGGVTALFADTKYDCGDIINQKSVDFVYPLTIQKAIELIEPLYFELVAEISQKILNDEKVESVKQNDSLATYSPWLDENDYLIDWDWSASKIERFVNAVGYPYMGARCMLNNEIVIFNQVKAVQDLVVENRQRHVGKVILMEDGCPTIICQSGLLKIIDIKNALGEHLHINFRSRFN